MANIPNTFSFYYLPQNNKPCEVGWADWKWLAQNQPTGFNVGGETRTAPPSFCPDDLATKALLINY